MDPNLQRKLLVDEYYTYLEILSQKGVVTTALDEETLKSLSVSDLRRIVNSVKDQARTPSS